MAFLNFYRGLKEKYNQETHKDGLFFSTDTFEILLNGSSYGGGGIADVQFSDGKLVFTLLNGTSLEAPINEATSSSSGLMSSSDKASLDTLLGGDEGSIADLLQKIQKAQSDIDNIGNVIIPEMNKNTAKALDGKVDWDSEKKVITLPEDGSISALQPGQAGQPNPEGGVLVAQRKYEASDAATTEIGTVKNYLTLNSKDGKVKVDTTGGQSNYLATENFVTNITNNKVDKEEGKSLVDDTLITKLEGLSDQTTIDQDITEAVNTAKETIDNYTVNGHKISENPTLTKADVGLGNVTNEAQIPLSQKGAANGVATLTENGKVPASQLPTYVDDVLEGTLVSPTEFTLNEGQQGEVKQSGVVYVDTTTNKSYRWSGSQYVMTGSDLALGETSSTAYAGDKGKQVTDRVAEVYSANSVVNGLSDITFDSDDTGAQTLSADNALKTWDESGTSHDMKIPYATASKAGVMSGSDKAKLDQLTNGLTGDTPSVTELEQRLETAESKLVIIQGEETVEGSINKALKDSKDYTNSKLTWTILE